MILAIHIQLMVLLKVWRMILMLKVTPIQRVISKVEAIASVIQQPAVWEEQLSCLVAFARTHLPRLGRAQNKQKRVIIFGASVMVSALPLCRCVATADIARRVDVEQAHSVLLAVARVVKGP